MQSPTWNEIGKVDSTKAFPSCMTAVYRRKPGLGAEAYASIGPARGADQYRDERGRDHVEQSSTQSSPSTERLRAKAFHRVPSVSAPDHLPLLRPGQLHRHSDVVRQVVA